MVCTGVLGAATAGVLGEANALACVGVYKGPLAARAEAIELSRREGVWKVTKIELKWLS